MYNVALIFQSTSDEDHMNQSLTSGELTQFFHTLRKGDSPGPQTSSVTETEDSSDVYKFKSRPTELSHQGCATLPRKPRSKASSPAARSQVTRQTLNVHVRIVLIQ